MSTRAQEGMAAGFSLELTMYDGLVMPADLVTNLQSVRDRTVRDDDIYICTFPKSGTHWMWEIVNMLMVGRAEYAQHWQNCSFVEARTSADMDALPSPRIFITHLIPRHLPIGIWKKKCRVINVQRNPKDAIVSFFAQHTNQNWVNKSRDPAFTGSWENYLKAHLKGQAPFDSVFDHMKTYDDFPKDHPDVPFLQVKYEDMKQDDVREIRRVADFLDRALPEETYRHIAEACSFENLKHASEHVKDQTFHNRWREGSSGYFRKGEVGDWKNIFTVAQSEEFDKIYQEKFEKKFPNS